jgi:hypothetical protein
MSSQHLMHDGNRHSYPLGSFQYGDSTRSICIALYGLSSCHHNDHHSSLSWSVPFLLAQALRSVQSVLSPFSTVLILSRLVVRFKFPKHQERLSVANISHDLPLPWPSSLTLPLCLVLSLDQRLQLTYPSFHQGAIVCTILGDSSLSGSSRSLFKKSTEQSSNVRSLYGWHYVK